jgi:diguanylate cyclase (GGDEF)-like protein
VSLAGYRQNTCLRSKLKLLRYQIGRWLSLQVRVRYSQYQSGGYFTMAERRLAGAVHSLAEATRAAMLAAQRHLSAIIIALVALMGISTFITFIVSNSDQARLRDYIAATRSVRQVQIALLDAETGVRGVVLSGQLPYLEPYIGGLGVLNQTDPGVFEMIDAYAAQLPAAKGDAQPVSHRIAALRQVWAAALALGLNHRQADAETLLQDQQAKPLMDQLRSLIGSYMNYRSGKADEEWQRITIEQDVALVINLLGALIAISATSYAFRRSWIEARGREEAITASSAARRQVETLFGMTDILQSAATSDDANAVLRATATQLLPDCGGLLYVFNNSRDRLDLAIEWGQPASEPVPAHIAPDACWALKRGKPHLNEMRPNALRCNHNNPGGGNQSTSLEIPIVARGEVHGLLALQGDVIGRPDTLQRLQPIAVALADAMSLALSNIALRERLRNQALRDALTGLYNRRFLEEMLERLSTDAERRQVPLAAIMIDLDHFKSLNDQHGHAAGDMVLRDVASIVLASLRTSDVACRYGGEELAILLPDCSLKAAMGKAEQIRVRIAATSANTIAVTASLGVASMPENCSHGSELLPIADAALYQAKDQGRDRVIGAPPRPSAEMISLSSLNGQLSPEA